MSPTWTPPALGEPPFKAPPRSARWLERFNLLVLTAVLLLGILLGEVGWLNASLATDHVRQGPVSASWSLPPPATVARPPAPSPGLCDGSERFCLSAESGQPAETLRQLAAVLTVEPAQRYQIHLTITPLEADPAPVSEALVPPTLPAPTPLGSRFGGPTQAQPVVGEFVRSPSAVLDRCWVEPEPADDVSSTRRYGSRPSPPIGDSPSPRVPLLHRYRRPHTSAGMGRVGFYPAVVGGHLLGGVKVAAPWTHASVHLYGSGPTA